MTKRARHTGSIQERGKGSWRLRYWLPPDADGKRKQATETVRGTKKEAEVILRERQTAVENGGFVPKAHETVAGFMRNWLETYAAAIITALASSSPVSLTACVPAGSM